jgi:nitroreductase
MHPDPVSDDDLWTVLEAATMAPSGGNRQGWNFVVIRDQSKKEKIAEWYLDAWNRTYGPAREAMLKDPVMARTFHSADHLANHLAECPVLILATIREQVNLGPIMGASIYPAVQNLMLAARAIGLGTALTTLHKFGHDAEVKALLGIPDGVETMALIPLGKPKGKWGRGNRIPVEKVVYWDQWGANRDRA